MLQQGASKADRQIKLSPDRLRRVLKKRGSFGNVQEKATRGNKTEKPDKSSNQT
jgi:hypothetical protein